MGISRPGIGIVPRDAGTDFAQLPVGSGPFRFVSLTPDSEIVLERNPDYFGDAPKIERVRFRLVPDATVRALELRKGSADLASPSSLTPDMVVALSRYSGIQVTQGQGTSLAYLAFNFDDPILSQREVRQALAYATDRATIVANLLRGQARVASSLLPPNHWAYDAQVATIRLRSCTRRDAARCRGIAAREGWRALSSHAEDFHRRIHTRSMARSCRRSGSAWALR